MKRNGGHPFLLATALVLATRGILIAQSDSTPRLAHLDEAKLTRLTAFSIIAHQYVDSVRIDSSLPIPTLLSRLDPFSWYETSEEHQEFLRSLNEQELRYGVMLDSADGRVILTAITPRSAADDAGFLPGDELLSVNEQTLNGNDSIAKALLTTNSAVTLQMRRESRDSTWTVVIRKSVCERSSVPIYTMIDSGVGYIQINGFHSGTASELANAVGRLRLRGMTSLILDLQWNSGGYVGETMQSLNLFIHSDTPVIHIVSRNAKYDSGEALPNSALYPTLPLAILVSNNTCSAAEIFSGVMQDLGRAVIVGQPTVGKSLVMQFFPLPNGDQLYLAMARYTLPTGRLVQRPYRKGVLIGGESRDYGSFDNSTHIVDRSLAEASCPTYRTAVGVRVTGCCGVIPDYFVSDAFFYPDWLSDRIIGATALYLRAKIETLLAITLDSFRHAYPAPEILVDWVLDDVRAHDTSSEKLLAPRLAWMVPQLIKAYIAYAIWGEQGFFQLWERNSATVRRAEELVSKPAILAVLSK